MPADKTADTSNMTASSSSTKTDSQGFMSFGTAEDMLSGKMDETMGWDAEVDMVRRKQQEDRAKQEKKQRQEEKEREREEEKKQEKKRRAEEKKEKGDTSGRLFQRLFDRDGGVGK